MNVRVMSSILKENVPGSENPDDMNLLQVCTKSVIGTLCLVKADCRICCTPSHNIWIQTAKWKQNSGFNL